MSDYEHPIDSRLAAALLEVQSAEVIPFIEPPAPPRFEPYCSFCKRKESEVSTLRINGLPRNEGFAGICGECAAHAKSRLEASNAN